MIDIQGYVKLELLGDGSIAGIGKEPPNRKPDKFLIGGGNEDCLM
ncbi:hypothetical protein [Pedobacter ginsengiterrae]